MVRGVVHVDDPDAPAGRDRTPSAGEYPAPFLWPLAAAAAANVAAVSFVNEYARAIAHGFHPPRPAQPQDWATPNRVVLELQSMQLRDFSQASEGPAALICSPFALHGATIADFAPGHSLIETLRGAGLGRVLLTDWRSATADMRDLTIDNYLADLNVAVDDIGPPVDLIGLCQGGWLALIYAARFPNKVRKLVLVGAPVDVQAAESALSRLAQNLPSSGFEELVRSGDGRVLGRRVLEAWPPIIANNAATEVLQIPSGRDEDQSRALLERFWNWYAWTVDLPGRYYLQVVQWVFKENRIADGTFIALGRAVDLHDIRSPTYLLAAQDDEVIAPPQLFAAARLLGTPPDEIEIVTESGGHLSLFLGADTLQRRWPQVAHWLQR